MWKELRPRVKMPTSLETQGNPSPHPHLPYLLIS